MKWTSPKLQLYQSLGGWYESQEKADAAEGFFLCYRILRNLWDLDGIEQIQVEMSDTAGDYEVQYRTYFDRIDTWLRFDEVRDYLVDSSLLAVWDEMKVKEREPFWISCYTWV